MTPTTPPGPPRPPLLADDLEAVAEPLEDDVSWSGVAADAGAIVAATASDCEVVGSRLRGVRFTAAELQRLRLIDTVLEDCELSGTVIEDGRFTRVTFVRCRLSGVIAAGLKAQDVSLVDCKIDGSNFRMSTWERAEWSDCALPDADFYGARLVACAFRRCDLTGLEVSKATGDGPVLNGSRLDGIKGAGALQGCVIGSDQVTPLAFALFASMGIRVDDDPDG